jgi:hypothetical protein
MDDKGCGLFRVNIQIIFMMHKQNRRNILVFIYSRGTSIWNLSYRNATLSTSGDREIAIHPHRNCHYELNEIEFICVTLSRSCLCIVSVTISSRKLFVDASYWYRRSSLKIVLGIFFDTYGDPLCTPVPYGL